MIGAALLRQPRSRFGRIQRRLETSRGCSSGNGRSRPARPPGTPAPRHSGTQGTRHSAAQPLQRPVTPAPRHPVARALSRSVQELSPTHRRSVPVPALPIRPRHAVMHCARWAVTCTQCWAALCIAWVARHPTRARFTRLARGVPAGRAGTDSACVKLSGWRASDRSDRATSSPVGSASRVPEAPAPEKWLVRAIRPRRAQKSLAAQSASGDTRRNPGRPQRSPR